jgi:hypothetical protein
MRRAGLSRLVALVVFYAMPSNLTIERLAARPSSDGFGRWRP